jgi:GH15 family glucan-1,4-alpha-glucosidase
MQRTVLDDVQLLLAHQAPGGAYLASPSFSQYPFGWLRDGAFIAHALERAGERDSAGAFHAWVARAVLRRADDVQALLAERAAGAVPDHDRMLPTRFTLEGEAEADGAWPDFQLDGYGQWLWSLAEHARGGALPEAVRSGAELVTDYLIAFWDEPCYDSWEEGRTQHHTATLASVVAGLRAAAELLDPVSAQTSAAGSAAARSAAARPAAAARAAAARAAAEAAWRFVLERCVAHGRFCKSVRNAAVDASLVWLATPFALVDDADPVFTRTLARVERDLLRRDGLLRFEADTFYGGGAWVLLTAGLAYHHARAGRPERAAELLAIAERHRDGDGALPEQVPTEGTDPWFLDYWTRRWGPSAKPLLWSHAMVLLARCELEAIEPRARATGAFAL